eukprot:scaffold103744_cov17-Tisochrysis_lutea.AAC.1
MLSLSFSPPCCIVQHSHPVFTLSLGQPPCRAHFLESASYACTPPACPKASWLCNLCQLLNTTPCESSAHNALVGLCNNHVAAHTADVHESICCEVPQVYPVSTLSLPTSLSCLVFQHEGLWIISQIGTQEPGVRVQGLLIIDECPKKWRRGSPVPMLLNGHFLLAAALVVQRKVSEGRGERVGKLAPDLHSWPLLKTPMTISVVLFAGSVDQCEAAEGQRGGGESRPAAVVDGSCSAGATRWHFAPSDGQTVIIIHTPHPAIEPGGSVLMSYAEPGAFCFAFVWYQTATIPYICPPALEPSQSVPRAGLEAYALFGM